MKGVKVLQDFLGAEGADTTKQLMNGVAHATISGGPLEQAVIEGRISPDELKEVMKYAANKLSALFIEFQYSWSNSDGAEVLVSSLAKHLEATADWEEPEPDFSDCQHGDEIMNEMAVGSV